MADEKQFGDKINTNGFAQNPQNAGYPKGRRNRSTIAKEVLKMIQEGKAVDNEMAMTLAQMNKAIQEEDTAAYRAILDSAYGPAQTGKDVEGDDMTDVKGLVDGLYGKNDDDDDE